MNMTWFEKGYIQGCVKISIVALEDHFGVLPDDLKQRMIAMITAEMKKNIERPWPVRPPLDEAPETPVQS